VAKPAIDDRVVDVVRKMARPVRFHEIADALASEGATRSQVHNAVYRLGKNGRLRKESLGGKGMTYIAGQGRPVV
jgi:hypothetical protein